MSSKKQRRESQEAQRARKLIESMTVEAAELVLVRHGETDWNKEHRLQGQMQPGPPLNEQGWKQCEMLSQVLQQRFKHFDAVVSSDLLRTVQTAEVIAAAYHMQVQRHPGLRERNLGVLQGLTYADAPAAQPDAWSALQSSSSSMRIPGGGESLDDLQQRMAATLLDIAAQYPGKRVLIISHGGALHAAHRAARGYAAKGKVFNCGISIVMAEPCIQAQQRQQERQGQITCSMEQQQQQQEGQGQTVCSTQEQQQHLPAEVVPLPASCKYSSSKSCNSCSSLKTDACKHTCIDLQVNCTSNSNTLESHGSCCAPDHSSNSTSSCWVCFCVANGAGMGACQSVRHGSLAMLSWNDGHELVAQGLLDVSSFGGSSKEA